MNDEQLLDRLFDNLTYAQQFAAIWNRHARVFVPDLAGVRGEPKAVAWDSSGEIEGLEFSDGSCYYPGEALYSKRCTPSTALQEHILNELN
jgi:hypothetical protein